MTKVGDRVRIHYTGRLEDGSQFDSSAGRDPLEFVAGKNDVIRGLDAAILEMDEGDSRTVVVPPEDAYGEYQAGMAQRVERERLPDGVTEGSGLRARIDGEETILWVTEIDDQAATVDVNHPLAGQTLVFDVEVVSVEPAE